MNKSKISKKQFIEQWGAIADLEFDKKRSVYSPTTGKKISTLDMAESRKRAIEEINHLKQLRNIKKA